MTKRSATHKVPFSAERMFALVADIEKYPAFVPHCKNLRVLRQTENNGVQTVLAEMIVQYKVFRERFKSEAVIDSDALTIRTRYRDGPVRKLHNFWRFENLADGGSVIHFDIEFEFKNIVMQQLSNVVFDRAFARMSEAFVDRAYDIYGHNPEPKKAVTG